MAIGRKRADTLRSTGTKRPTAMRQSAVEGCTVASRQMRSYNFVAIAVGLQLLALGYNLRKRHYHGAPGAPGLRRSRWPGSPTRMNKFSYSGYRFPPEIIQQAIWLYLRFTLSLRDVEDLLAERGVAVSYETVRRWVNHFGPMIAADLRKRRPKPYTTWHLDEVYLKIDGRMVYLWRTVDAEGEVLDVLVQSCGRDAPHGPSTARDSRVCRVRRTDRP